jgi:MmyB-like transcription regulator ligand binding domain
VESSEFAAMWAANTIRPSQSAVYRMQHPIIGHLTITQQLLTTAQAPGQTLVICSAPKNTPSAQALSLLARTLRE